MATVPPALVGSRWQALGADGRKLGGGTAASAIVLPELLRSQWLRVGRVEVAVPGI